MAVIRPAAEAGRRIVVGKVFKAERLYKLLSETAGMEVRILLARTAPEIIPIGFAGIQAPRLRFRARSAQLTQTVAAAGGAAPTGNEPMEAVVVEAMAMVVAEAMAGAVGPEEMMDPRAILMVTVRALPSYPASARAGFPN